MLKIELRLLDERRPTGNAKPILYEVNEFHCELSILSDICDFLQVHKLAEFFVCGFGQEKWPIDVRVDLCTIIEELPVYCNRVMNGKETLELDFYEQGIERTLEFANIGTENIRVGCSSRCTWQPDPAVEFITTRQLHTILEGLSRNFREAAFLYCPFLAKNALLADFWTTVDEFCRFSENFRRQDTILRI